MKRMLSVSSLALLCACSANWDVEKVADMDSEGNSFDKNLKNEYVELAIIERSRGDWDEVDRLLTKAMDAAEGRLVGISEPVAGEVSEEGMRALRLAYKELQDQFRSGARDRNPRAAAQAQLGYDCMTNAYRWNIEADIVSCRNYYNEGMAELKMQSLLQDFAAAAEEGREGDGTAAAVVAAAPVKSKIPESLRQAYMVDGRTYMNRDGQYLIYYAFNDYRPSQNLDELFKDIAAEYQMLNPARVEVSGYTDTAGSVRINQALSERRAKTVAGGLVKAGVDQDRIDTKGYGKANLDVMTEDGVAEPRNRRTVIEFKDE